MTCTLAIGLDEHPEARHAADPGVAHHGVSADALDRDQVRPQARRNPTSIGETDEVGRAHGHERQRIGPAQVALVGKRVDGGEERAGMVVGGQRRQIAGGDHLARAEPTEMRASAPGVRCPHHDAESASDRGRGRRGGEGELGDACPQLGRGGGCLRRLVVMGGEHGVGPGGDRRDVRAAAGSVERTAFAVLHQRLELFVTAFEPLRVKPPPGVLFDGELAETRGVVHVGDDPDEIEPGKLGRERQGAVRGQLDPQVDAVVRAKPRTPGLQTAHGVLGASGRAVLQRVVLKRDAEEMGGDALRDSLGVELQQGDSSGCSRPGRGWARSSRQSECRSTSPGTRSASPRSRTGTAAPG